ncbi:MAG: ATP-dependent DNA helicase RecG [Micavibrio sp.]|nr:ATP-dependent DNA helicase RecG [Micavibrio sp.]|tara:strand:- start:3871 stop:5961 length:2091 start_codon:yes stop_codon:yes gene_type:complete
MSQRPFILDPLFRSLTALPGVGPKNAKLFEKLLGGPKVLDLLFHLPIDFIDRRFSPKIKDAPNGRIATMEITVGKHFPNARRSAPYRVQCSDETGTLNVTFFHANKDWIKKQLPEGAQRIISGKVEYYQGQAQMVHPDIAPPEERASLEAVEPVYPLTQGVTNKTLRKAMDGAIGFVQPLPEWCDNEYKKRNNWPDWHSAVHDVHHPPGANGMDPNHPARARLAYDELLSNQLTLALVRDRQRKKAGRTFNGTGELRSKVTAALPFELTGAQKRSLDEIDSDMSAPYKMLRLLQGDVGSGKTIVAAFAMLRAIESGAQAALMAPTEILARQHYEGLKPYLETAGVRAIILTGRDKGKARDTMLAQIRNGAAQVIIGTHAIFQDAVTFKDLGLAVIDEQHRFGVHQRLALSEKGKGTDVLVMTATPIPRTLTLTAYGDMDVSRLDEKPPGRKPVDTRLIPSEKIENMIAGLKRQINNGARVYWVCPLVEESEKIDLAAAEERYDILKHFFGADNIGLIHGRMKGEEKDAAMAKFITGETSILVATTVIEVGVNVPEATIMVIEHAERFGLSQLHQLRGRVGRGADKSYCFLLYHGPLGETAKERLATMRETEDGFVIAEKDLQLRGAGDILGTRQSGIIEFKLAIPSEHAELIAAARDDARLIIDKDPKLESKRGQALKTLLYLFERDQAIKYLGSG